jgi:nucleoside-diphosphate-sugar epimerase
MNIFLAGATGVIGRRLVPLLRDAGHNVTGMSRSEEKASALQVLGATGVVVDVYDARALLKAMSSAYPDVVIHQLTDLPPSLDAGRPANFEANARLRIEGTKNLMAAAAVCGVRRAISQSIAFVYADGPGARVETNPLDRSPARALTIGAVESLEQQTLGVPGIEGVVLRYGRLYGPGTWYAQPAGPGSLHVDAAAQAALLAVTRGQGIYNIAEDDPAGTVGSISSEKAKRELGFDEGFRITR